MTTTDYSSDRTGLLLVDPYNDFLSEGGKLWPLLKEIAEEEHLLDHLRQIVAAARAAKIQLFIVPHHRWEPSDYAEWRHPNPSQIASGKRQTFAKGTWGGEWHPDFVPQEGDVIIKEHWAQSGFANTDLDQQLKQHGIENVIVIGLLANTCIESTSRFAMELGYHVTLVKDATAALNREMMRAAHELNGPTFAHAIFTTEELLGALSPLSSPGLAEATTVDSGFAERFAEVNGVRLRYLIGGKGSPVVLLHGYAETSHMWHPIMPLLAERHTVIVPDLRGAGGSSKPEAGYDKKNMAVDIHELTASLGLNRVSIVGHDIGLMVAYAFAAQFPQATERVVLMDAFLPGIGSWKDVWLLRDLWHFHFYGDVPLALVHGRERTYFEHFWNDFAADPKRSIPEADRRIYAQAYAQLGGMRAGFEYFRNFERDAQDFAQLGASRLAMPVLVLTGERASGNFLIEQAKLVASDVRGQVVGGAGHWLMEEAPQTVIPAILDFVNGVPS
jgi:pimeloyl-ACP methyl ester carboxylesterase/nicotinamidase-related amidase